jgi:hypothetical protein
VVEPRDREQVTPRIRRDGRGQQADDVRGVKIGERDGESVQVHRRRNVAEICAVHREQIVIEID